jgi:L-lactate dehydrogenase complex protein LldG
MVNEQILMAIPVNSEAREAIMQSIRAHLAKSENISDHHAPASPVSSAPINEDSTDAALSPVAMFCERLESVGGHCVTARDEYDAVRALTNIVAALQNDGAGQRIALSDAPILTGLTRNIAASEITVGPPAADLFNFDVGITTAQAGIAETGTLVLEAEKERHRLVSLLPPVHIAVLRSRDIYLTIGDALQRLRDEERMSRAITFITGPSRTADIELTLTVGVHGPKEVYVIVLEE